MSADLGPVLRARLANVSSVGVITGAGISAESGIPTYRGKGGLYDDPERGDATMAALTGEMLARDPDRTWRTVAALARAASGALPNRAHEALVELESRVAHFALLTQNVDNLHRQAGSRNLIPIHGDVRDTVCMACTATGRLAVLDSIVAAPRCRCGGTLRPGVVLFGESLPENQLRRLHEEFLVDPPDLVLVIGTTAPFPYIVEPVLRASAFRRLTIEVNPEPTELTPVVGFSLRGRAGDLVPLIVAAFDG